MRSASIGSGSRLRRRSSTTGRGREVRWTEIFLEFCLTATRGTPIVLLTNRRRSSSAQWTVPLPRGPGKSDRKTNGDPSDDCSYGPLASASCETDFRQAAAIDVPLGPDDCVRGVKSRTERRPRILHSPLRFRSTVSRFQSGTEAGDVHLDAPEGHGSQPRRQIARVACEAPSHPRTFA